MNKMLNNVDEFHRRFELTGDYNKEPGFVNDELMSMRLNFLLEELDELAQSTGFALIDDKFIKVINPKKDLAGALDALVDLSYVLHGTVLFMGMGEIFDEAWDRVQQANMTKERTKRPEDSKRGSGYDVVKPVGWKPPTFDDLLK